MHPILIDYRKKVSLCKSKISKCGGNMLICCYSDPLCYRVLLTKNNTIGPENMPNPEYLYKVKLSSLKKQAFVECINLLKACPKMISSIGPKEGHSIILFTEKYCKLIINDYGLSDRKQK